jgi:hypothetical protein
MGYSPRSHSTSWPPFVATRDRPAEVPAIDPKALIWGDSRRELVLVDAKVVARRAKYLNSMQLPRAAAAFGTALPF